MTIHLKKSSIPIFLLILIFSTWARAQSLTFWATTHPILSHDATDPCDKQKELLFIAVRTNPDKFPNLIFAQERLKPADRTEKLMTIEDEVLRDYYSLFYITHTLAATVDTDIKRNNFSFGPQYNELIANYFNYLKNEKTHPNMAPYGNKIISNDAQKPYLKLIEGDVELTTPRGMMLPPITPDKYKSGLVRSMYHRFTNLLSSMVDSYVLLSANTAKNYYDEKLRTQKTKYNIKINGKNALEIVALQPENLFKREKLQSLSEAEATNELFRYWRDHYITVNSAELMKKNPKKDILVWLGINHIPNVKTMISKTASLTDDQKSRVRYITIENNRNIACNYPVLLDAIKQSK